MDRYIEQFPAVPDGDLMLCEAHGVAYQTDMTPTADYDAAYFEKCGGYDSAIATRVNDARLAMVGRHFEGPVLDVGIGAGHFVQRRPGTFGYDINPAAVRQLLRWGRYAENFADFRAFTFWDVIEHLSAPQEYFDRLPTGSSVFVSLPVFENLWSIRKSHHYRPGEHLLYFTHAGFIAWMSKYGFRLMETNNFEQKAGRDSIVSYAFYRK